MAETRQGSLAPGRRLRPRGAGLFLLLPLVARMPCAHLVTPAGYPGSQMVPAPSAWLSLLTLKLLDKARRRPLSDGTCAEALGLWAGRHRLPKTPCATDDSSRTPREPHPRLLAAWLPPLAPLLLPDASACGLDFPPRPSRGDPTGLATHDIAPRGTAGTRSLPLCAHEPESRVLCDAKANLTRADQAGDLRHCIAFWPSRAGCEPQWLSCDAKVARSSDLSRGHQRGMGFVTMRRRGAAVRRRLHALPAHPWRRTVVEIPQRCHQHGRSRDETVKLRGYAGPLRPGALDGFGRAAFPLLVSHNLAGRARERLIRSAGRHGVEDRLGIRVHGLPLDGVASEGRLHVDMEVALTVLANGGYRWWATPLHGVDQAKPHQR